MKEFTRSFSIPLAVAILLCATAVSQSPRSARVAPAANLPDASEQIFALANQARAEAGLGRLEWDQSLADAALKHCRRSVAEGPISHRYNGEPDLSARAAAAGASFSLIEENIAVAPSASIVHNEWMHSPGHRSNLLNPEINRVGIAVIASSGVLYAVADYSRAVDQLSPAQVESRVAALVRSRGVEILRDPSLARAACRADQGMPRAANGSAPEFIMRWQSPDLTRLPQSLVDHLASGRYRQAAIGSCPARTPEGAFAAFRLAVLLY